MSFLVLERAFFTIDPGTYFKSFKNYQPLLAGKKSGHFQF